nr:hypothetical protein [Tanacetum cinerariifolium]
MDDPNITMEEYIKLEEEKARRQGQTFNWQTATYGKIGYYEDDSFTNLETEYPTIVFDDTSNATLSCEPTVSPFDNNEIDFNISFDESEDEDYMCIDSIFLTDMAPLPHHDLRHPRIRYQVEGYDEGVVHSYEYRLETIFGREVNRVHVLDFARLTGGMRQTLADRLSMVYIGDDEEALFTSDTWRRLFEVRGPLLGGARRRMTWRQFILALGLHSEEEMAEAGFGAYWSGSAQAVPAPVQAPQPPPPALQHRNMSQRIDRLELEVCELRQSVVGLRGLVESFITEQSRVSTWMISCMTYLMDASGHTYQAFNSTLIGSSRVPYQRRVRPRTGDASTSAAPHIEDQSDP